MISVSNEWKALQNQTLLPEMFVEVTYTATEPGLQWDATVSGNYPEPYSRMDQIVRIEDKVSEKYATLDYGAWGLDGNYCYSDGSPSNPGYVDMNYSDDNGLMGVTPYPTITMDFSERRDVLIPGLTITWSESFGGWATSFRISAYNSTGMIAQKTVTDNTYIVSEIWVDLIEYTKITVEVLSWSHPYQRVRCTDIRLGIKTVYTKSDLLGYSYSQSIDLLSAVLPKTEVSFSLRNDDNRWNPDNPIGSEKYLLEQQEIKVRYGMDINGTTEWIKGGTFWLSEWNTPSNGLEASFVARDATNFMSSAYTGIRVGTLYDVAMAAFIEADLPIMDDGSLRYVVHESLREIQTDFSGNTQNYRIAEVLQMVAHAGGCVFYQDRDGRIHIEPRSNVYSGYMIEPMICYSHPEYTINKPLRAVSVGYGDDLRAIVNVDSKGEIQTIDNPLIVSEEDAIRVGENAKEVLVNRKVITGEFRADMRLDALDNIIVVSKYASNVIGVTDVSYSTTGSAFKGTYTGRVVSVELNSIQHYVGEIYVGEV